MQIANGAQELVDLDRLAQVGDGAGFVAAHHVFIFVRSGENDDRDLTQAAVSPDALEDLARKYETARTKKNGVEGDAVRGRRSARRRG